MDRPPYRLTPDQLYKIIGSEPNGLSSREAAARLHQFGENVISVPRESTFSILTSRLSIILLCIVTAVAWSSGSVLLSIIALSLLVAELVGLRVVRRFARQVEDHLQSRRSISIYRDGQLVVLPINKLVPGDVIWLTAHEEVPADVRIIEAHELTIDESTIGGESAMRKSDGVIERSNSSFVANMALTGSIVHSGFGKGLVVATARSARRRVISPSHWINRSHVVSQPIRVMAMIGLVAILSVVAVALFNQVSLRIALLPVLLIVVAVIPDELLSIEEWQSLILRKRLLKQGIIVDSAKTLRDLASINVLVVNPLSLGTGNYTVTELLVWRDSGLVSYPVTGRGNNPEGEIVMMPRKVKMIGLPIKQFLTAALLDNPSGRHTQIIHGDPFETALAVLGKKAGISDSYQDRRVIPFRSSRLMITDRRVIFRGPVSDLLGVAIIPDRGRRAILEEIKKAEKSGGTLYGVAVLALPRSKIARTDLLEEIRKGGMPIGWELLGLVRFEQTEGFAFDRFRELVRSVGIGTVIVSSQSAQLVHRSAKQLGFNLRLGEICDGREIVDLPAAELHRLVGSTTAYHHLSGDNLGRIIESLEGRGNRIATIGSFEIQSRTVLPIIVTRSSSSQQSAVTVPTPHKILPVIAAGRMFSLTIGQLIATSLGLSLGLLTAIGFSLILFGQLPVSPAAIVWLALPVGSLVALCELSEDDHSRPITDRFFWSMLCIRVTILGSVIAATMLIAQLFGQSFSAAVVQSIVYCLTIALLFGLAIGKLTPGFFLIRSENSVVDSAFFVTLLMALIFSIIPFFTVWRSVFGLVMIADARLILVGLAIGIIAAFLTRGASGLIQKT